MSAAQASTTYPVQRDLVALDGQVVSSPYGLVAGGTTYMPIWYVTEALARVGVKNSWNGHILQLVTPSTTSVNLEGVSPGHGDMSILINGTLVQHVSGITYIDPSSNKPTTYMPIWYIMQVLNRLGIRSNWDGLRWDLWNTPIFGQQFLSYIKSRSSTVSVAVYDAENGQTYLYNPNLRFDTASIVKAIIMANLLHQTEIHHTSLSPEERSLMPPMIEDSNNYDASELWNLSGGAWGIDQFLRTAGLDQTTPGLDGYWGLTQTSALDQVNLVRDYAYPNQLLGNPQRNYGLYLMEHVVSWEDWGVSGGVPRGSTVALKNGWLPIGTQGWEINSIGYINGVGRNYVVGVLTRNNPSEGYGIATIEGISRIIWSEL
ncbi:hypothetical protein [Alicyclobacillus sp. ALC3]|uniref:hypothetical protein n=1 Tax=Alicyclobacillus sp. ALC3 TaxID=2796143 RepID=UPI002378E207|nr:hypothetical protein [Alicyclobacillus sp. ALC3]WDL98358.1 hypothetical protein JC200_06635 [Alicyclobacillus sp. ALC3]